MVDAAAAWITTGSGDGSRGSIASGGDGGGSDRIRYVSSFFPLLSPSLWI
jgi:hypothetical protein